MARLHAELQAQKDVTEMLQRKLADYENADKDSDKV